MSQRQFDRVTKQVPWPRVLVEGIVIVVSILLAFGIDAWWDEAQESQGEREALADLRLEVMGNLHELEDRWLPYHRAILDANAYVLWHALGPSEHFPEESWPIGDMTWWVEEFTLPLATSTAVRDDVVIADQLLGLLLSTPTYDPTLSSLEVLFQSGSLEKLDDRVLRGQLAALPAALIDVSDEEKFLRDFVFRALRPLLAGRVGVAAELLDVGPWSEGGLPPELMASKSIITISPELVTVLARRTSLQANILVELEGIRDRLRSIVTLIDGETPGDAP